MRRNEKSNRGFSVIELMVAVLILMIGVVAVARLIPAAMRTNLYNRYDSTSVVIAQRVMAILSDVPVNPLPANFSVQACVFEPVGSAACVAPATFNLGNAAAPGGLVAWTVSGPNWAGAAVTPQGTINWTQAAPPVGYGLTNVVDPTDPTNQPYEVRWATDTRWGLIGGATGTPTPLSRRIIVSVRRQIDPTRMSVLIPPTSLTVVRTNGIM